MTDWLKAKVLGRIRVSTLVLIVAFVALFWVNQTFQPEPQAPAPTPAVVPPGFVPDPNYTWVPRTDVRRPTESQYTTTTPTTTTTTPSPTTTTPIPTSPTETTPTTTTAPPGVTVVDPDGPGLLPPVTLPVPPPAPPPTPPR